MSSPAVEQKVAELFAAVGQILRDTTPGASIALSLVESTVEGAQSFHVAQNIDHGHAHVVYSMIVTNGRVRGIWITEGLIASGFGALAVDILASRERRKAELENANTQEKAVN